MIKKKKNSVVKGPVKKGALCLFLITIKAPQSLLTPKVLKSHQKDEKAVITVGQRESPARVDGVTKGKQKFTGPGWM